MPGWHEATKQLQQDGRIQMAGIIQEQHPDRTALFMQWKDMDWPVLVDAYNLLEVPLVPITLAIDERGIIRRVLSGPGDGELGEAFLRETFGEPAPATTAAARPARPDVRALHRRADQKDTAEAWRAYGDAIVVWGGPGRVYEALDAYERAVALDPQDRLARFRLGVAYRARHDGDGRREGDFQRAVEHWAAALDLDPNQYIWRRRIQQYGPRLDKPYPFYDWVIEARTAVRARGEEPVPLVVEPGGSEFATPMKELAGATTSAEEPDPAGRVIRDDAEFIDVETVVVPPRVGPGEATRVHFVFRPIVERLGHWNNEADDMVVWIDPPAGWQIERRLLTHAIPQEPATQETRTVEVELRAPEASRGRTATVSGYALYYVCEDVNGICTYRRRDLEAEVRVR